MSSSNVGLVMRAWFRWKSLRLPWRKRFLVGSDLQGNTYWSRRLPRLPVLGDDTRWRRIVKYPRSTHYSVVQVSPQWHQWLRYQRAEPPSLAEQQLDVVRRERMKVLAAEADARWAAKPSYLDQPRQQRDAPPAAVEAGTAEPSKTTTAADVGGEEKKKEVENPWKAAATGPSETWQPAPWTPSSSRKR
ncbi:hypothetical protein PG994_010009 [Apiospora phragmitis]|uniref:NADH dehydrogenase [ubiquinone] 1 alpha subcomplex subunit n=1 Tax=Apiospora phragmitis TaxID=2905665 RepID=A0ABR1TNT9_9PEZI